MQLDVQRPAAMAGEDTTADVRERVAREVFTLDADWRREYWDQFRRDFPRQAQAYYDTADRILAILPTPRGEGEADEHASCTCEWMHPTLGTINPHWPAVLDPECIVHREAARHSEAQGGEADALDMIRWAEARAVALEPVAGNIMPPGTYACYVRDDDDPYMGPGILGAIRAARPSDRSESDGA
jgi:hypothetical protein